MYDLLAHIHSFYDTLLIPFGDPDFGPKLATALLALALAVLFGFLLLSIPQAVQLRAALAVMGRTPRSNSSAFESRHDGLVPGIHG
jgi:hypothetical protein